MDLAVTPAGGTARTIACLAHTPALVEPFLGWAAALHLEGCLSRRHHEILALRAAHNCGSDYEWVEHLGWARRAGLDAQDIEAVTRGDGPSDPIEATLVRAADELAVDHSMTAATRQVLLEALGPQGVVEVAMVVGQYTMLSMLANIVAAPVPGGDQQ